MSTSLRQQWKETIDRSPQSLLITDKAGVVVYTNKVIEQRTGFSVHQTIGKRPGELWGGNMDKGFYREMWTTISRDREAFVAKAKNRRQNGVSMQDMLHITPIISVQGEVQYYLEVQPQTGNSYNEAEFTKVFPGSDGGRSWMWLWGALTGEEDVDGKWGEGVHITQILADVLVEPTQAQYVYRQEDADLINASKYSKKAFGALYRRHHQAVRTYLAMRVSSQSLADDLAQETFLRAYAARAAFRVTNASYLTYLLRIAHNLLVNHYRSAHAQKERQLHTDIAHESGLEKKLLSWSVWEAAKHLSDAEYEVLILKYREQFSVREVALYMQRSENAVKLLLSRGRKKIRDLLLEEEVSG